VNKADCAKKSLSWQHGHVGGFVATELTESLSFVCAVHAWAWQLLPITDNR
jgi:hypothetical protein